MANYATLKAAVADVVKTNGTQAITGANLQSVLLSIINSIGTNYTFAGVATPSTSPGTPDYNVAYIGGAGTYANFGTSVVVPPTNIAVFKYNGAWTCEQVTVENGGVFDISAFNSVGGTLATYSDLATALGTNGANIPVGVRKGGMSIKFVQSSDNKYVQYRLMSDTFNTTVTNWQGVDSTPIPGSDNLVKSGGVLQNNYSLLGIVSKVVKPSSAWYGSITGQRFNIVANEQYYISNVGHSKAVTIRLYNENLEVVETKDINIEVGESKIVSFSHNAARVDIYFSGADNELDIYTTDSYRVDIDTLQKIIKSQNNSVFEDYRTYGTGIVGFGVMGDFTSLPSVKNFRFNTYSFNNNVLYGDIQGLIGDEWTGIDSINHTKGDSNIEIVESVYHRFFVVVNYSLLVATSYVYRNLDWQIRNSAVQFVTKDIYGKLKDLISYVAIPSYELKDSSVVNISVKKDGTGDFTTIGDAIASIGNATARNELSSFEKQYCIRVFPGVYNEVNLFIPDYVHIYGLHPNTVTVTSVGLTPEGNPPVFDMYGNSKLSNMTIISAFGYCVHIDSGRGSRTCVCENLYCKKVYNATSENPQGDDVRNNAWMGTYTNPSIIGMGMGINEYKFLFKNCTFENGWVAAHTNANNDTIPNTRIEYRNCKLVNAIIDLQTLDNSGGQYHTDGKYICVVDGLKTQRGRVSLRLDYFEGNSAWSVLGGCNDNFVPSFNNLDGTSESWENLNTTEKSFIQLASGVSCTKGQFIDCDGNICTGLTPKDDIVGIALDAMSADSLDAVSVWIGNAFLITLTDGEYGIGADGKLSASATNKIGHIKNNIFYRY